jgi:hypothetical protein
MASRYGEKIMVSVAEGQCGLCAHYGEEKQVKDELLQIRQTRQAPEQMVEECDHPKHADLNLMVTPISKCDGFTPAN